MAVGRSAAGTIYNIQVVRFIAAAMVLFGHLEHELVDRRWLSNAPYTPFQPIFWAGGVDIFFVVSGFIMYYVANQKFGKRGAWSDFIAHRFIRIAPPYWLFTGLMIIASLVLTKYVDHSQLSLYHVIASFLFIPDQNAYGGPYPVLMLGWTLNYEMLFYVIFCLGLLFQRRVGLVVILVILLGLAVISLMSPSWFPLYFWANPIVLEFSFGIALARLRLAGVRWSPVTALAMVAAGFALMAILQAQHIAGHYWALKWLWMGIPAMLIGGGLFLAHENNEPGALKKILVFAGDCSYALYLSHPFTLNLVALVMRKIGPVDPNVYLIVAFSASVVVAGLIFVYVERPIYTYLNVAYRRWCNRQRTPDTVAV
jgi:peptidoglycan/LPS O-acetylase OafA/YrhL